MEPDKIRTLEDVVKKADESVEFILRKAFEWQLGKALDLGRISGMTDRSFKQFERTLKDECNRVIETTCLLLKNKKVIQ